MVARTLNTGFGVGPKTIYAQTGKFGVYAPNAAPSHGTTGGGATQVFNYANFSSISGLNLTADAAHSGNVIALTPAATPHHAGGVWYTTPVNIQSFTTNFQFQLATAGLAPTSIMGMTFCIQNSNQPAYGGVSIDASADANCCGYGSLNPSIHGASQQPINNSVAVKFDLNLGIGYNYPLSGTHYPSTTGLYINGGTYTSPGSLGPPYNDMAAFGINLYNTNVFAGTIFYDGSALTLVLKDTVTGAQYRNTWQVNIPQIVGANTAIIGFTAGNAGTTTANMNVLNWNYYTGYNSRLSAPSFGIAPGQYTLPQTVSISGTGNIYYTTDGLEPTSNSTLYSAPITISSDTILKAVAIQNNYTDSQVTEGLYQISSPGTPQINFPSGFTGSSGLINTCGTATIVGTAIQLTDGTNPPNYGETGAAWVKTPLPIGSFTSNFQFNLNTGVANGIAFVLQNPVTGTNSVYVTAGGYTALSGPAQGLGLSNGDNPIAEGTGIGNAQYAGLINSVGLVFGPITYNSGKSYVGCILSGGLITPTASGVFDVSSTMNFQSGHNFNVAVSYDGTTLSATVTDASTSAHVTKTWTVNIPSYVGSSTAYAGFTGGSYGGTAQLINNWTFS
jgi:hypothetical protein